MAVLKSSKPKAPRRSADPVKYERMKEILQPRLSYAKAALKRAVRDTMGDLMAMEAQALGVAHGAYMSLKNRATAGSATSLSLERTILVAMAQGIDVRILVNGEDVLRRVEDMDALLAEYAQQDNQPQP